MLPGALAVRNGGSVPRKAPGVDPACTLCQVLADTGEPRPLENTPLAAGPHFVVMPVLGPLVRGHVMVVAHRHFVSLRDMGEEARAEYEEHLAAAPVEYQDNLLEIEHGSVEDMPGGPCIVHAHAHWLPGLGGLADLFDDALPRLPVRAFEDLREIEVPYVALRSRGEVYAYDASACAPQTVRRSLARALGETEWDWALFPKFDVIKQTAETWHASGQHGNA